MQVKKYKVNEKGNVEDIYPPDELVKHIKFVGTGTLRKHERTNKHKVPYYIAKIRNDGMFTSPIMASVYREFTMVVDGMHRVDAITSEALGFKFVPIFDVDYLSDERVQVYTWARSISGYLSKTFSKKIVSNKIDPELVYVGNLDEFELETLEELSVCYNKKIYQPSPPLEQVMSGVLDRYEYCSVIERLFQIEKYDTRTVYLHLEEALKKIAQRQRITILPPRLTKHEVYEVTEANERFPIHSTRHVFPYRVLGTLVSISDLKSDKKDVDMLTEHLQEQLFAVKKDDIGYYPGGIIIERYYPEPTVIFNESKVLPILRNSISESRNFVVISNPLRRYRGDH